MLNKTKEANMNETFTFFWGSDSVFSNWNNSAPFVVEGTGYNCMEKYMMAAKARLFDDQNTLRKILNQDHPREIKKLGREVKNFNGNVWDSLCKELVFLGCYNKFTQNKEALLELTETRGTVLVEASPYDKIWGVGLAESDDRIHDRKKWLGENRLGQILTDVRDSILESRLPVDFALPYQILDYQQEFLDFPMGT
jgi:ribA/ribD-fused uncharacterized protein